MFFNEDMVHQDMDPINVAGVYFKSVAAWDDDGAPMVLGDNQKQLVRVSDHVHEFLGVTLETNNEYDLNCDSTVYGNYRRSAEAAIKRLTSIGVMEESIDDGNVHADEGEDPPSTKYA